MEHAGESGVQLSVAAEMVAYGVQAAVASSQLCCKSGEEPSRKPCNHQQRVVRLESQTEDHAIACNSSFN